MSVGRWIQAHFYETQILLGFLFLLLLWLRVGKSVRGSQFRTREHERSRSPQARPERDASKNKSKLYLPGIAMDGKPHEVLGVRENASEDEILRAFRELMKRYHPDKAQTADAKRISQKIIEAKSALIKK